MEKNMLKEKSAVLLAAAFCAAFASAAPMKFLSFNVWGDYFKNPVNEREAAIESTIRKYSPDVVALQEMTPAWWESPMLGNLSSEYGVVRGDEEDALKRAGAKGPRKPRWINHEPLLYRKSRLALLDSGLDFSHLRLGAEKSATWAVLEDKTSAKRFIAFATHFWYEHKGAESDVIREYNALQIMWRISEVRHKWGNLPVILGGDMNSVPGSLAHDVFARNGFVTAADAADVRSEHRSYHLNPKRGEDGKWHAKKFPPEEDLPKFSIDHVFYTAGIHALKHVIDTDDQTALDATDHWPVAVDFEITGK